MINIKLIQLEIGNFQEWRLYQLRLQAFKEKKPFDYIWISNPISNGCQGSQIARKKTGRKSMGEEVLKIHRQSNDWIALSVSKFMMIVSMLKRTNWCESGKKFVRNLNTKFFHWKAPKSSQKLSVC
jgi:hypothetical protein